MFRLDSNEKNMQTTHEFLLNFIFSNKIWISWIKIHNGYSRKKNSKNKRKIYQTSEKHIYRLAWNCDKKYFASENKVVRNLAVQNCTEIQIPREVFLREVIPQHEHWHIRMIHLYILSFSSLTVSLMFFHILFVWFIYEFFIWNQFDSTRDCLLADSATEIPVNVLATRRAI